MVGGDALVTLKNRQKVGQGKGSKKSQWGQRAWVNDRGMTKVRG